MRYVLLSSLPWIEELNRLGLVILSYTGAAVALKNHSHLGLSIVTDKLSPKGKKIAGLFSPTYTKEGLLILHEKDFFD